MARSAGSGGLIIVDSSDAAGIDACYPLLRELCETLGPEDYKARLADAMTQGYRLARAMDAGGGAAVGVIGYRLWKDLIYGRSLFVDDLVVTAARRGEGIGAALLRHAEAVAREEGCTALRLLSGLQRTDAHGFYEAQGLHKRGHTFVKAIG